VIADRTDGNPLFTQELAQSIAQSSSPDGAVAAETIPRTVRDLLTARLDALGERKRMAQVAAVIGREVDVDLLRMVTGMTRRQLTTGLGQLASAGVVEEISGVAPHVTHRFVHSLVRDAAYESQTQKQRLDAHLRVAEALTVRPNVDPGLIAQHFDAARVADKAVEQYVVAATAAQTAAADAEAIRYLDRALELVVGLPDGAARDVSELTVHVVRGRSHVSMQGFGAPGAADDYRRSLELSERVGARVDVVPATTAVWAYYLVHGDLQAAAEALSRLEEMSGPEFDGEISCCAGVQHFFEGRITEARRRLEASVAAFAARLAAGSPAPSPMLPSDSYAVALTHLGSVLWLLGEPRPARARLDEAAQRARTLPPYPIGAFTEAYVSSYAAWVAILAERFDEGRLLHEHTTQLAERYEMLFWLAAGQSGTAIGLGYAGEPRAALEQLEPAMGLWQALGAAAFLPFVVTQRAQIRMSIGELREALADVDQALDQAEATNEHFFSAESHRIRAAILLQLDPAAVDVARAELTTAKVLAADQGALVFELRAAIDLVRLLDENRPDGDLLDGDLAALRTVVGRLPAGAQFPDLDRARSLLAESSPGNGATPADDGRHEHGDEQGRAGEHIVDPARDSSQ
jgi:tetratricopeptide (TPR) repeat protein